MAITITNDAASTRTNLGLGDAATKTTGTGAGNVPLNSNLSTVATSGAYADVSGTPTLSTVATSGAYADVSGTPTFKTVGGTSIEGSGNIESLPTGGSPGQVVTNTSSGAGTWQDVAAGGKVLQVVQQIDTNYAGTTSTSYVSMGLTKNITVISSTSKFLVTAAINGIYENAASTGAQGFWKLAVNGSNFPGANSNHHTESGRAAVMGEHSSVTLHMLDTGSKTAGSTHTYAVYLRTNNGQVVKYGDTAGTSTITIMEIEQ